MEKVLKLAALFTVLIMFSGCATQGVNSFKYTEPVTVKIENEITVNKPYSAVWDSMVKQISKSFYVINNIDKESRILNLSFTTNKPADYVDCGRTSRTYTQGEKIEKFEYDVAGSSDYKAAGDKQNHPSWATYALVHRKASLEGRSNIYVAPSESDSSKTVVSVNTRYVWTVNVSANSYSEHAGGNTVSHGLIPNLGPASTISFNTLTKGDGGSSTDNIFCISKGTLEKEILGLVVR